MKLNEKIKELRLEKGLTQKELADATKIPVSMITKYEQGVNEPSFDYLIRISEFFECPIEELIKLSKNIKPSSKSDEDVKKIVEIYDKMKSNNVSDERKKKINKLSDEIMEMVNEEKLNEIEINLLIKAVYTKCKYFLEMKKMFGESEE